MKKIKKGQQPSGQVTGQVIHSTQYRRNSNRYNSKDADAFNSIRQRQAGLRRHLLLAFAGGAAVGFIVWIVFFLIRQPGVNISVSAARDLLPCIGWFGTVVYLLALAKLLLRN